MFLIKLKEYADERMSDPMTDPLPPSYTKTPIAYIVRLRDNGKPLEKKPQYQIDSSNAHSKRGRDMVAPYAQRTSGVKPLLLADQSEYTFGRARDSAKQESVDRKHAAYLELLDQCAKETAEPAVLAVQRFFERGGAELLDLGDEWDNGLKVTFQVQVGSAEEAEGEWQRPIDLPSVQRFWRRRNISHNTRDADHEGQCIVCGERKPVLDRLPTKIKGIPGGQTSGTSIISANSEAFESYGLKASRTAPICLECAESSHDGLNDLLSNERSRITVARKAAFVFWTREQIEFDPLRFIEQPDAGDVHALLESVRKGRRAAVRDATAFYAASLSASGGRTVVRDWIDTTVGSAEESIAKWFRLQRIVDPRTEDPKGTQPRPISLYRLAASTVRKSKDLPVSTTRALFGAALSGRPVPLGIAFQAVRRCRAEQGMTRERAKWIKRTTALPPEVWHVTRERAALIKLTLLSQEREPNEEDYMVALAADHPEPAYHCGRLLAVIEEVQRAALPGVNASIVDRYYGAASSTPAVVFGGLCRGAQPHLARLERDKPGAYVNLQRRLEDVMSRIADFPATLSLPEQALFSLGYYHQRAQGHADMISRRAARDADGAGSNDATAKE